MLNQYNCSCKNDFLMTHVLDFLRTNELINDDAVADNLWK